VALFLQARCASEFPNQAGACESTAIGNESESLWKHIEIIRKRRQRKDFCTVKTKPFDLREYPLT
jgi:hypothetical protein